MERRKIELAALADKYYEMNGRLDPKFNTFVRKWAEENPLFPQNAAPQGTGAAPADDVLPPVPDGIDPANWRLIYDAMTPEGKAAFK